MPSQARDSSWSCDYCGVEGFRSFEDVKVHEHECQESARNKRPRSGSPSEPFSGPGMVAAPSLSVLTTTGGTEMGSDYDSSRPRPPRRITIMAPEDMHRHQLDRADALACQNIEVFEAGPEFEGDPRMGPIAPRQVGIRCIHCALEPTDQYNMFFPGNIEAFASGIQMVAERHFAQCAAAPEQARQEFQRANDERRRVREEGRSTTDEERSQMAMMTYCSMFCRNCGIVDKYPPLSGVSFVENERQMFAPTPRHPRGPVDMSYPPMSDPRQPYPLMMSQMGDAIAPTPLARSAKDPNDPSRLRGFESDFSSGFPTPSTGAQTTRIRADMGPGGPRLQHQGPPQESPFGQGFAMLPYGAAPPPPQEEFPYYQDTGGSWSCKYCSRVPPQYRDEGAIWKGSEPPPSPFINQHLHQCRSYNPTFPSNQGPPTQPPGYVFSPSQASPYGGPPPPLAAPPTPFYESSFPFPPPPEQPSNEPRQGIPPRHTQAPSMPPMHGPRGNAPLPFPVPSDDAASSVAHQQAIDYLIAAEQDMYRVNPALATIDQLVLDEDRMLLTDYFFYLMKQLRVCRFTEADRKTRGGKRENIAVGYGGLQCIHCAGQSNARKFFWSNVDRLANSFAEIPAHVLKCRRTPNQTKTAIMELKSRHPEQMGRLPRGSQKVFFRRMWRRLHESDPKPEGTPTKTTESKESPVVEIPVPSPGPQPVDERISPSTHQLDMTASSPGTSTDESAVLFERPADEAAKALAGSVAHSNPPSPSSRVLLGIPEDKEWLSDMDCFIRRNLEVFCATAEDVDLAQQDRKYPIAVGQVGIRCIHCAIAGGKGGCRRDAVAYPYSISGVYEAVREFERLHLGKCKNVPLATKQKLEGFKGASSLSSVLRKYYVLAAKALGMYDTPDGIRSGGESAPVGSSAAFAFTEGSSLSEEMQKSAGDGPPAEFVETGPTTTSESRKRKQPDETSDDPPADAKPSATVKTKDPPSEN